MEIPLHMPNWSNFPREKKEIKYIIFRLTLSHGIDSPGFE